MLTTEELRDLRKQEKYELGISEKRFDDFINKQDWYFLRRQINQQRLANKLIKEIYQEAGIFSFHNMEMAVANLARIEAYKYTTNSREVWFNRYLGIMFKGLIRPYRIFCKKK